jgi:hypothetical protein
MVFIRKWLGLFCKWLSRDTPRWHNNTLVCIWCTFGGIVLKYNSCKMYTTNICIARSGTLPLYCFGMTVNSHSRDILTFFAADIGRQGAKGLRSKDFFFKLAQICWVESVRQPQMRLDVSWSLRWALEVSPTSASLRFIPCPNTVFHEPYHFCFPWKSKNPGFGVLHGPSLHWNNKNQRYKIRWRYKLSIESVSNAGLQLFFSFSTAFDQSTA